MRVIYRWLTLEFNSNNGVLKVIMCQPTLGIIINPKLSGLRVKKRTLSNMRQEKRRIFQPLITINSSKIGPKIQKADSWREIALLWLTKFSKWKSIVYQDLANINFLTIKFRMCQSQPQINASLLMTLNIVACKLQAPNIK
jgi:hypothetical protein